jgi:hypothetical protein
MLQQILHGSAADSHPSLCPLSFVSVLSGFSSVSSVCLSLPQLDSDSSAFLHPLWKNQSPGWMDGWMLQQMMIHGSFGMFVEEFPEQFKTPTQY